MDEGDTASCSAGERIQLAVLYYIIIDIGDCTLGNRPDVVQSV
jgi:hypothetical protein